MQTALVSLLLLSAGPLLGTTEPPAETMAASPDAIARPEYAPSWQPQGRASGSVGRAYRTGRHAAACGFYYRPTYNYLLQFDYPWHPAACCPKGIVARPASAMIVGEEAIATPPAEPTRRSSALLRAIPLAP